MLAVIHLDKLGLSISKETQTKGAALTFGKKSSVRPCLISPPLCPSACSLCLSLRQKEE